MISAGAGATTPSVFMLMAPCRRLQFNLSDLYPVARLGIGVLAGYLRAHGAARVELRDIIAEREWIPDLLARFESRGPPDLLGCQRYDIESARGLRDRPGRKEALRANSRRGGWS